MHKWTKPPTKGQVLRTNPNGARESNPISTDYTTCKYFKQIKVHSVDWNPDRPSQSYVYFKAEGFAEVQSRFLNRFSPSGIIKFNTRKKY